MILIMRGLIGIELLLDVCPTLRDDGDRYMLDPPPDMASLKAPLLNSATI